ncbi:ABC transporter ATP-binding protein [Sedimentibacter hydroxybenzoicus DSM 7310]|uniref:ABC transporter ATP-binding protein n=1 Tax=Sedimentibacter hydroxybenzoicus DSM 7310 TaxID=1123245 RepID=A0A974GVU4_SEDHY|nr:ABC transporter ATP-binding protein [Sedimentibacter hydroxybenzoicus]NYB73749.1 ABC transporter ATP-binding protein [Sedimentibacter hydroxybenzoicus DSM 7310]
MSSIILKNISKQYYHDSYAVRDLSLEIKHKEFIVLVGPSGCGKSTTLRMIAGLEEITEGSMYIDEREVNSVEAKDRNIAIVFQDYALYPHMNVYNNMAFGLKMKKIKRNEIKDKIEKTTEILDIKNLLYRYPSQLSGGEKQRVALGRAMVKEPKVFLLDEPLSNLDAGLKARMRLEIMELHKKLDATFIYVTHDQTEAMTMADRIAVMKDGLVMQFDTPSNIYNKPDNIFVAKFIGSPQMNVFEVYVQCGKNGVSIVKDGEAVSVNNADTERIKKYSNKKILAGVRPEHIKIHNDNNSAENFLSAKLYIKENLGHEIYYHFNSGKDNSDIIVRTIPEMDVVNNHEYRLWINPEKMHFFDAENGNRI